MARYQLFAARDGNVINVKFGAESADEARLFAAHQMYHAFQLQNESTDFEMLAAETDGVSLAEEAEPDFATDAHSWARAQLAFLGQIKSAAPDNAKSELSDCVSAIEQLASALEN